MKGLRIEGHGLDSVKLVADLVAPNSSHLEPNQVIVKVKAAALNPNDVRMALGYMTLFTSAAVPGVDVAGIVTAVGSAVSRLSSGHRVHGLAHFRACGCFAEYVVMNEDSLVLIPEALSFSHAASLPCVAETSLQALQAADLRSGQSVLILGGSGGTGSAAIQIAKAIGATVIVTCSERNSELCKSLGASETIDYNKEDFGTRTGQYDVVLDCVGANANFGKGKHVLRRGGRFVAIAFDTDNEGPLTVGRLLKFSLSLSCTKVLSWFSSCSFQFITCFGDRRLLEQVDTMVKDGKMRAVIDSEYRLEQFREAYDRQATGRVRGKVVLIVEDSE